MEQWKDIPGYEGLYMVSSIGRVKSLTRDTVRNNQYSAGFNYTVPERLISDKSISCGYKGARLCGAKGHKRSCIHRLVAMTFIPNPENKPQVNHKNGNKKDNRVENLEWCTRSENMRHAFDTGLLKGPIGIKNRASVLTENQVIEIRQLKKSSNLQNTEIAKRFNVNNSTIGYIINGKTWAHII